MILDKQKLDQAMCDFNTANNKYELKRINSVLRCVDMAIESATNEGLYRLRDGISYSGDDNSDTFEGYIVTVAPYGILLDAIFNKNETCYYKDGLIGLLKENMDFFNSHSDNDLCYIINWKKFRKSYKIPFGINLNRKEISRAKNYPSKNDLSIVFIDKTVEQLKEDIKKDFTALKKMKISNCLNIALWVSLDTHNLIKDGYY